jgi:hypothetical protein
MTSIKKITTTLMLGLALTVTSAVFAQKAQSDSNKKESCCAMPTCCGNGDSCPMKEGHKDHAKNHSAKDGCCCGGDSCDMKKQDKQKGS